MVWPSVYALIVINCASLIFTPAYYQTNCSRKDNYGLPFLAVYNFPFQPLIMLSVKVLRSNFKP